MFVKRKENPNNNFHIKSSWDGNLGQFHFGDFEKIQLFFIHVWIYLAKHKIRKYNFQCPVLHTIGNVSVKS